MTSSTVGVVNRQCIADKLGGVIEQLFGAVRVGAQLTELRVFFTVEGVFAGNVFARWEQDAARPAVGEGGQFGSTAKRPGLGIEFRHVGIAKAFVFV